MEIEITEKIVKKITLNSRFFKYGRYYYKICSPSIVVEVYYNGERQEEALIQAVSLHDVYQSGWEAISESDFKEVLDIAEDIINSHLYDSIDVETQIANQEAKSEAERPEFVPFSDKN